MEEERMEAERQTGGRVMVNREVLPQDPQVSDGADDKGLRVEESREIKDKEKDGTPKGRVCLLWMPLIMHFLMGLEVAHGTVNRQVGMTDLERMGKHVHSEGMMAVGMEMGDGTRCQGPITREAVLSS